MTYRSTFLFRPPRGVPRERASLSPSGAKGEEADVGSGEQIVQRPGADLMSIYMLDTSWATTADERRHLHWELLASYQVCGVFLTARDDALVVLFSGDRRAFNAFESGLPEVRW
jgi:hypothetical protein